jgi:lysophospholipase L1-like esterase
LAGALSFLWATSSSAAIRAVTPTAWSGYPKCWQMERHNEKMSVATNGGAKVVFIGDSIMHGWERTVGIEAWKKYFADGRYSVLNLGYGGDRTEHVLWRLTEGRELDGYEAKVIVLMIGTNNTGCFPFDKEPPVDTILGVREILRVIAKKQPNARTILTAIFPRGATPSDPNRMRNDVVNKELSKFADGRKAIWCDFTDRFLDAEGRLSRELFYDLLHPTSRGYEVWASAIVPLVETVLNADSTAAVPSVWPMTARGYSMAERLESEPVSAFPAGNWWGTRCLEKRNEIVDNGEVEYDIVMVGDSITHRWERDGGEGRKLFAELKKTYRILNLGYGGDCTQHVIWRMMNGELEGYKAKLFTLMIGTNNGGRDAVAKAAGVERILHIIREKHPESKIVLMPIFPRADDVQKHRENEKVNALIRNYADGNTVMWLDFNGKFLNAEGKVTKDVMNDLLHPNEKGYQIWFDAILPTFRKVCGK